LTLYHPYPYPFAENDSVLVKSYQTMAAWRGDPKLLLLSTASACLSRELPAVEKKRLRGRRSRGRSTLGFIINEDESYHNIFGISRYFESKTHGFNHKSCIKLYII